MNPTEYQKNQLITESSDFPKIKGRVDDKIVRLLHAATGFNSELSELVDASLQPEVDYVNVSEECGDFFWYISVACNTLGLDPEVVMANVPVETFQIIQPKNREDLKEIILTMGWAIGEFNDYLKKYVFYGKELNIDALGKSLQALNYSILGACRVCETTPEKIRETNIAKLRARYGDKFTEAAAITRDLDTERKILEG